MKKKYFAAALLSAAVLLSGCAGNVSRVEDQQDSAGDSSSDMRDSEVSTPKSPETDKAVQASSAGSDESDDAGETVDAVLGALTEESAEEVLGTLTIESPWGADGYSADWLYGTWSVISVNDQDFWEYADANGFENEYQLTFDSSGGARAIGVNGDEFLYRYRVTDNGARLYDDQLEVKVGSLTYDPDTDLITMTDTYNNFVMKRGSNPRGGTGENSGADWIYGVWSVTEADGQDYWKWVDENHPEMGESIIEFTADGARSYSYDREDDRFFLSDMMKFSVTGSSVVMTDEYGDVYTLTYDSAKDLIYGDVYTLTYDSANDLITASETEDDHALTLKRGTNPRSGEKSATEWVYGTWSISSVNGKDYWTFADEEGIWTEKQLVFLPDYCLTLDESLSDYNKMWKCYSDGSQVIIVGDIITGDDEGEICVQYNSATDMIRLTSEEQNMVVVMKRGSNPRTAPSALEGGDWVYGTWRADTMNGVPFKDWAYEHDIDGVYGLKFTHDGCAVLVGDKVNDFEEFTVIGSSVIIDEVDDIGITYDSVSDTLTLADEEITCVMKRSAE